MRAAFPDDFETLTSNQNARRRRRDRLNIPEVSIIHLVIVGSRENRLPMVQHWVKEVLGLLGSCTADFGTLLFLHSHWIWIVVLMEGDPHIELHSI